MIEPELSRRAVLKSAVAMGVSSASGGVWAQEQLQKASSSPATHPAQTFYYVDGYHGGVDGHMPQSSLPNVLDGLEKFPHWKVTFEIEPYSWAVFAKSDPHSIERLKRFLADATPAGRIEIVSGAYGQPYMWNASGECNIRHLAYGLAELHAVFPELIVDTYAVQEPCWTSCLPQILKSFGYRRAVLKNSTCWGGYHAPTLDADLVHWVGPDGSSIPTVPRYAVEPLVPPATIASAQPTTALIDRCLAVGIEHPAGTILQDMGWPGRPWRLGMSQQVVDALRYVTWREYTETIASPPSKQWKASQEDLRVGLPWGGSVLQRIAQIVRLSEHRLVQAEKIASMALVRHGTPFPGDAFKEAWKLLLWSQHHDVWIVSQNRHGNGTWASEADAKFDSIQRTCRQIVDESAMVMAGEKRDASPGRFIRVFNTIGSARRDLASIAVPPDKLSHILDASGREVTCQVIPAPVGTSEPATLLFLADVPSLGYATYQLTPADERRAPESNGTPRAVTNADGSITLETDLLSLTIDPAKGGCIRSLVAKDLNREFVDQASPRSFNEFRGYFPNEAKWLSSVDAPAEISIVENGPLRVAAIVRGRIGVWPFVTRVKIAAGQRRIDFETTFEFPVDSPPFGAARRQARQPQQESRFRLGEPWEPGRDAARSNQRPFYDASFKLQALFPAKLQNPVLDKNAPFDVCRATNSDTRFNAWDSIKNNVIFNWVDLVEESGAAGLAVMTDHVTSYCLAPGEPLGLVMCYAGPGIWHDYGLGRVPRVSYSVLPHAGNWAKAQLWEEHARWSEPLVTTECAVPGKDDAHWSLLDIAGSGIEVTTVFADGKCITFRLFNAEGDPTPKRLTFGTTLTRARLIELDGRTLQDLPVELTSAGTSAVTFAMPRFAIRTLRCELAQGGKS